jgi:hypothetical protein
VPVLAGDDAGLAGAAATVFGIIGEPAAVVEAAGCAAGLEDGPETVLGAVGAAGVALGFAGALGDVTTGAAGGAGAAATTYEAVGSPEFDKIANRLELFCTT